MSDEKRYPYRIAGNHHFHQAEYDEAIRSYTKGITVGEEGLAILLSNRANAYLRLACPEEALQDAARSIESDPTYKKAYFHRGAARLALHDLIGARQDFSKTKVEAVEELRKISRAIAAWPRQQRNPDEWRRRFGDTGNPPPFERASDDIMEGAVRERIKHPEVREFIQKCNLTEEEAQSVLRYSWCATNEISSSIFDRLPYFVGVGLRIHHASSHEVGDRVHYHRNTPVALRSHLTGAEPSIMAMRTVSARALGPLTLYPGSPEVVLPAGWIGTIRGMTRDEATVMTLQQVWDGPVVNPCVVEVTEDDIRTTLGSLAQAISRMCTQRLEDDPYDARAHWDAGVLCQALNEFDKAEGHFEEALLTDPSCVGAHCGLGLLSRHSNPPRAQRHYEAALSVNPLYASAHNNLGVLMKDTGHLSEAVRLDPRNVGYVTSYACLLAELGQYQEAATQFETALALKPTEASTHSDYGHILSTLKEYAKAQFHLEEAIRINPKLAIAHLHLGIVHAERQQFDKAREHYAHALRLDPKLSPNV